MALKCYHSVLINTARGYFGPKSKFKSLQRFVTELVQLREGNFKESLIELAIASDWPLSSASTPG